MVGKGMEGVVSRFLILFPRESCYAQQFRERCCALRASQKEQKMDQILTHDLQKKKAEAPQCRGVVQQLSQPRKSLVSMMLPVSRSAILVNGHEYRQAPRPAFEPVKQIRMGTPIAATVSV